jgi:hypothetical protein
MVLAFALNDRVACVIALFGERDIQILDFLENRHV